MTIPRKTIVTICAFLLITGIFLADFVPDPTVAGEEQKEEAPRERVRIATTTSLYDTGLWDLLEPKFEERFDVELDVLYAGTGIALEYGRRGDVDAITVHARKQEEQFVRDGYGIERVPFAYNYFLIVGPPGDPAAIRGKTPHEAFRAIAASGRSSFISRGDNSGTHSREKDIWSRAGFDYEREIRGAGSWYIEAGRGMGPTLLMASEKEAYTLCDTGTFYAYRGKIELVSIVEKGTGLLNVYSVIACDPVKNPGVNQKAANDLVLFMTSPEAQESIGKFGFDRYGSPLFYPCAGAEPSHSDPPETED